MSIEYIMRDLNILYPESLSIIFYCLTQLYLANLTGKETSLDDLKNQINQIIDKNNESFILTKEIYASLLNKNNNGSPYN